MNLENNLFDLYNKLATSNWKPDYYETFFVQDPKLRKIHKASVRDRVLYQAVYKALYQIFDPSFIFHSFSSRKFKGIYAGIFSFEKYIRKYTKSYSRSANALKCDIRKFFDSIDHQILFSLIFRKIKDDKLLTPIKIIINSFEFSSGKGLPLGNVTSQLFSNIYLNEMDQYVKHELKAKCYVRYCDDFIIASHSKKYLESCVENIKKFCNEKLKLDLHPNKITFRKTYQGVDFLGYVMLPHRRVLRTKTKNRLLTKLEILRVSLDKGLIKEEYLEQVVQSYLGLLSHCKGEKIVEQIERIFWD